MSDSPAHEEDGHITAVTDFDYDAIDRNLFDLSPEDLQVLAGMSQKEMDNAFKMFDTLLRWVWQNGMRNPEGMNIRTIIACWLFIRELRPLTETDLARIFGKDKQSLGRWVVQFKEAFPFIKSPHFK